METFQLLFLHHSFCPLSPAPYLHCMVLRTPVTNIFSNLKLSHRSMRDPSLRIFRIFSPVSRFTPISVEVYLLLCQTMPSPGLLGPFTYHCLDLSSSNHMSSFFVPIDSLPKNQTNSIKENTVKPLLLLPAH